MGFFNKLKSELKAADRKVYKALNLKKFGDDKGKQLKNEVLSTIPGARQVYNAVQKAQPPKSKPAPARVPKKPTITTTDLMPTIPEASGATGSTGSTNTCQCQQGPSNMVYDMNANRAWPVALPVANVVSPETYRNELEGSSHHYGRVVFV